MNKKGKTLRLAPFALRIVQRKDRRAAIIYRRRSDEQGRDRFQRLAALSPLAYSAAIALLRDAVSNSKSVENGNGRMLPAEKVLSTGAFHPISSDWGARVACYSIIAAGLRDAERLLRSAEKLHHSDPTEAAWWLGLLTGKTTCVPFVHCAF